jgi:hypothetical protein
MLALEMDNLPDHYTPTHACYDPFFQKERPKEGERERERERERDRARERKYILFIATDPNPTRKLKIGFLLS